MEAKSGLGHEKANWGQLVLPSEPVLEGLFCYTNLQGNIADLSDLALS